LNVVVGWMLGIHLSTSVSRWFDCVKGYLELMDTIRTLQMQFYALGLPDDLANPVLRQAYASTWLLYHHCMLETRVLVDSKTKKSNRHAEEEAMWNVLGKSMIREMPGEDLVPLFKASEAAILRRTRDQPAVIWMWIACHIGRYAQDGWLPPLASPTYGRVMNLVTEAYGAIRTVRTSVCVQSALMYTHFMATIVHINNLLCAVCLGLVGGIGIGTWMVRRGYHMYEPGHVSQQQYQQDFQNIAVTVMYSTLGPILFHGLLLISMDVSQPFDRASSAIPVDQLLCQLDSDMNHCRRMMEHLPFERPYFKELPPVASPKALSSTSAPPLFAGTDVAEAV
jgi:hypothetical protein